MRWKIKPAKNNGELRSKKRFLLFPMCIEKEWRWLEIAEWTEKYTSFDSGNWETVRYWSPEYWIKNSTEGIGEVK